MIWLDLLLKLGILLGFLLMMVWFHELGHWLYFFKVLKKKVTLSLCKVKGGLAFRVGNQDDYVGMSDKEYAGLSLAGVLAGLIPMFFLIGNDSFLPVILFLLYVLGCVKDIKNVLVYYKNNPEEVGLDE